MDLTHKQKKCAHIDIHKEYEIQEVVRLMRNYFEPVYVSTLLHLLRRRILLKSENQQKQHCSAFDPLEKFQIEQPMGL